MQNMAIRTGETEALLVEAKLNWANLDMENDELAVSLKLRNDRVKSLQEKLTSMEI